MFNHYCVDQADENECFVNGTTSSCVIDSGKRVPLRNETRCGARQIVGPFQTYIAPFCSDFLDQTNCSDYSRVALHCPVKGYMSTVAKQIVCPETHSLFFLDKDLIPNVCDDGLDKACVKVGASCFVHKHQLCDKIAQCIDDGDESGELCQKMTDITCKLRFVDGSTLGHLAPFPIAWINDGLEDCWNGEDENEEWPACGAGKTTRYKNQEDPCTEVFLCNRAEDFVELSKLCDRIDSCEKFRISNFREQGVFR
jgi:hypothetical protein